MGSCCAPENERTRIIPGQRIINSEVLNSGTKLDSNYQVDILNHYEFIRVLGYGQFGTVREAQKKNQIGNILSPTRKNGQQPDNSVSRNFAIKSIMKEKVREKFDMLKSEIVILKTADHPNIVRLYEIYEDDKYIHLVMDLCTGGDLLDFLIYNGPIPEHQVIEIMRKLLSAVNHLHSLNICHRDLKPENILLAVSQDVQSIKIADFGVSAKFSNELAMTSKTGTPYYIAPEVLAGKYRKECDIWSLGVIMYYLLSGEHPFQGFTLNELFRNIVQGEVKFEDDPYHVMKWSEISQEAKELITQMLTVKAHRRISLNIALTHPFFQSAPSRRTRPLTHTVVNNISKFRTGNKLRKEILKVMIRNLNEQDIIELRDLFSQFDREKTGLINVDDIINALRASGQEIAGSEMQSNLQTGIVKNLKGNQDEKLKYTDFLSLVLDTKKLAEEDNLWVAFKLFDYQNTGSITLEDFRDAIASAGGFVSDEEMEEITKEFQLQTGAKMTFLKFKEIMTYFDDDENTNAIPKNPGVNKSRRLSIRRLTNRKSQVGEQQQRLYFKNH